MTSNTIHGKHQSHVTRSSDSSLYDEKCINCGATDITGNGWGKLALPCKSGNNKKVKRKKVDGR